MIGNSQVVLAKTTSYQIDPGDCAAFFTNRGAAGSVTFTLPDASTIQAGWWCEFYTVASQTIVIASTPADFLLVHADASADSVTLAATAGQHCKVIYDGTRYLLISDPSAASAATAVTALTIAT